MRLARWLSAAALVVSLCLCLTWLGAFPAAAAPKDSPEFALQVAKQGLTFNGTEQISCRAEVNAGAAEPDCSFVFKLYRACSNRSELSSSREGKPGRLLDSLTLEDNVDIPEGTSQFTLPLNLAPLQLSDGVYPYTISLSGSEGVLAGEPSFLVIRSQPAAVPLNLVLLWNLHQSPSKDFSGQSLAGSLLDSNPSPSISFMGDLLKTVMDHPRTKSTLALAPMTYADLQEMKDGGIDSTGDRVDASDPRCQTIRDLLDNLQTGASAGAFGLLPTTFGYADLEALALKGWDEDVAQQIGQGQHMAAELTGREDNADFFPPRLGFYDGLIPAVQASGIRYTVLSQDSLATTKEGSKYLDGPTLAQPLSFGTAQQGQVTGFVVDGRLYSLLQDESPSLPPHQVLQNIMAELEMLAEELPNEPRVCTLLFPDNFTPGPAVLEQLYAALEGAPWLNTETFDQACSTFAPTAPALELPSLGQPDSSYLARLSPTRDLTLAFQRLLLPGNPLSDRLNQALLRAESSDFLQPSEPSSGDAYLQSLEAGVRDQMSKISLGIGGSITLSSQRGNIPVLVTNKTDYAVKATLRVHGSNVEFPEGDAIRVVINPKENRFEVPVIVAPGGSQVNISVEQDGLLLDTSNMKIKTSSMNTLAIWLLIVVVLLLAAVALFRRARRRIRENRESSKA